MSNSLLVENAIGLVDLTQGLIAKSEEVVSDALLRNIFDREFFSNVGTLEEKEGLLLALKMRQEIFLNLENIRSTLELLRDRARLADTTPMCKIVMFQIRGNVEAFFAFLDMLFSDGELWAQRCRRAKELEMVDDYMTLLRRSGSLLRMVDSLLRPAMDLAFRPLEESRYFFGAALSDFVNLLAAIRDIDGLDEAKSGVPVPRILKADIKSIQNRAMLLAQTIEPYRRYEIENPRTENNPFIRREQAAELKDIRTIGEEDKSKTPTRIIRNRGRDL